MINKQNQLPKHPNISFKQYCEQFVKESPKAKLNKTTLVFGDQSLNKLREKQKEQFKSFIQEHITQTRKIRDNAECDATMYMGLTSKWQRAKNDYFKQEISLIKHELDMRYVKQSQELNFDSWRRIDSVSQKRVRGFSVDTTMKKTHPKTFATSFRF
ncbi:unnamed protein product (macronuclear) [Paramecium tetraurelia]|uniref:Uncharacterized protein n=1 Tax=Paramecium tetraurelia TaxID=5888 RepID=A0BL43_PARTE|nr:uncharacterized protein GSPATT00029891001 [Paramecium tetraurelia]CAK59260.1 unnamed protein product [Paramecium tetraurelia]|eukprot:XP_001426658.1 hypothetical protein (macronuclear) [Paramecium tetraurelia strain d4-2]